MVLVGALCLNWKGTDIFHLSNKFLNAFMYITLLLIPKPVLGKAMESLVGNLGGNEYSLRYNPVKGNKFMSDGAAV